MHLKISPLVLRKITYPNLELSSTIDKKYLLPYSGIVAPSIEIRFFLNSGK